MSEQPSSSQHDTYLMGVLSQFSLHLMLFGITFLVGVGWTAIGVHRPNTNGLLPGGLLLGGSLLWWIPIVRRTFRGTRWVEVGHAGLRWQDGHGEKSCSWEEIEEVYRVEKIINQSYHVRELRVVMKTGEELRCDKCLSDYDLLSNKVLAITAEHLLPFKRASLPSGTGFGPVTVSTTGIKIREHYFSWDEVEHSTVYNGCLLVFPKRPTGKEPCEAASFGDIPNYPVLLQLLGELGQAPVQPMASNLVRKRR